MQRRERISHLIELIEQRKNADFKSTISSIERSHLLISGGNTLMHAAVASSNIEIIVHLFDTGFDINARNELGQTPLHLAIANRNNQVTQLLLSLDADILIADSLEGLSALQLCFKKESKVPDHMVALFFEGLVRSNLPARQMADLLEDAGCSIHQALIINVPEVIGLMLDGKGSVSSNESRALLERAMSLDYPENVRVLLERGLGAEGRLEIFFNKLTKDGDKEEMKGYFERFIDWDVVTRDLSLRAQTAFRQGDEVEMQVYFDIGIVEYAKKKFGWELLVGLFRNENVDCVKIVKSRKFDVNRLDMSGTSALHVAVACKNKAGVLYLLENGGDPNVRNSEGKTPLFTCGLNDELTELLLDVGAELQAIDYENRSALAGNLSNHMIANLCILEEQGLLKPETTHGIEVFQTINRRYLSRDSAFGPHRQDIKWMKARELSRSFSLFTVLADKVENTARHVKSEKDVAAIMEVSRERELKENFRSMLMKNLEKARKVSELRRHVAAFLSYVMKIGQVDHLVIEKIVGFLNYRDLLVFDKIDVERCCSFVDWELDLRLAKI